MLKFWPPYFLKISCPFPLKSNISKTTRRRLKFFSDLKLMECLQYQNKSHLNFKKHEKNCNFPDFCGH